MPVPNTPAVGRQVFASTRWTAIRACTGTDASALAAREEICRDYWYPIYAYIKRQGNLEHDAEDLTQGFFAYILERGWFAHADQTRGRFRSFLLASLNNFLHDESDRRKTRKRGGTYQHIPLDMGEAAVRYARSEATSTNPAHLYEAEWASTIVATSLRLLAQEYTAAGKSVHYQHLESYLMAEGEAGRYEATAAALGTSLANVKVLVHRLRQRYKALLREQVALTVAAPEDVDEEMRYMRAVLAAV